MGKERPEAIKTAGRLLQLFRVKNSTVKMEERGRSKSKRIYKLKTHKIVLST